VGERARVGESGKREEETGLGCREEAKHGDVRGERMGGVVRGQTNFLCV